MKFLLVALFLSVIILLFSTLLFSKESFNGFPFFEKSILPPRKVIQTVEKTSKPQDPVKNYLEKFVNKKYYSLDKFISSINSSSNFNFTVMSKGVESLTGSLTEIPIFVFEKVNNYSTGIILFVRENVVERIEIPSLETSEGITGISPNDNVFEINNSLGLLDPFITSSTGLKFLPY